MRIGTDVPQNGPSRQSLANVVDRLYSDTPEETAPVKPLNGRDGPICAFMGPPELAGRLVDVDVHRVTPLTLIGGVADD